jgi:curli biogenesis system outer membrane secretion channel CsgG
MKSVFFASALSLAAVSAFAQTTVTEQRFDFLPKCDKAAATLVVSGITCKAAACQPRGQMGGQLAALMAMSGQGAPDMSRMGDGVGAALTTALKATGCFEIQEREALEELRKEMELAGMKLEAKPADFMILGAISSLEAAKSKSNIGGGILPVVGGFSRSKSSVSMSLDLRIVNTKSASVVASKAFTANSENASWGIAGAGLIGAVGLLGSHSENKGDPSLDRVATDTVVQSVHYLVDSLARNNVTYRPPVQAPAQAKRVVEEAESVGESNILGF